MRTRIQQRKIEINIDIFFGNRITTNRKSNIYEISYNNNIHLLKESKWL
jgi:hypothetical protein